MTSQFDKLKEDYYSAKNRIISYLYLKRLFILVSFLIALPPILGLLYIKLFGVNLVFQDQWILVPLIEKQHIGTLTLEDLFAQYNEHRIFFPRIIMLILAYITNYNTIAEMYFSWILAIFTFILILKMFKKDFENSPSVWIMFVPIAWILFSFRQFENILWGMQIQIYLSILGFVAMIYMLEKSEKINYKFLMAILCGVISTFSFFNGLIVWPVGFVFIFLSRKKNKKYLAITWASISLLVGTLYFYNWVLISTHPSLLFFTQNLIISLTYLMVNIGAPLSLEQDHALFIGIILVLYMLVIILIMNKNNFITENAKWLSFIFFSFMSSIALTIGRSGFGVEQALASRYITITSLGIIGLYAIIICLYNKIEFHNKKNYIIFFSIVLSIIIFGTITGYIDGMTYGRTSSDSKEIMVTNLINYNWTDKYSFKQMDEIPNRRKVYARILDKYKLNVFYKISDGQKLSNPMLNWSRLKYVWGGLMVIDAINNKQFSKYANEQFINVNTDKEQFISIEGWAIDDKAKDGTVKAFLVLNGGKEEIILHTAKTFRPDVAEFFKVDSYKQSGWSVKIIPKEFEAQCYNISVRILRTNSEEYNELYEKKPICFSNLSNVNSD